MTSAATAGPSATGSREITAPGRPVPGPPWLVAARDVVSDHPLAADFLLAFALMALVGGRSVFEVHLPLARLFSMLLCAPLIWRRRYPLVVYGFQCVVALTQWTLGYVQVADVALLLGLYTIAAHRSRRWAVIAAGVLELGVVMSVFRWWIDVKAIPTVVFLSGMVTAAFVLGVNLRTRRAYLASLEDRALRAEFERDQQSRIAAAGERARIAREMHDIVAHNLSVMIALADGAAFAVRTGSPQAEIAARQVSDTGRQALAEMQRLLGVLRDDEGGSTTTRAPQPGIDQLDDLIAQVRATGLAASLTVSGQPFPLPTTAQLAVYRVVQEALTNVLKHATAPTRARVTLCYEDSELRVDIVDDGGPANSDRVGAPGHGLAGMRERAALFGGEVTAGPLTSGGWRVTLRIAADPGATPTAGPDPNAAPLASSEPGTAPTAASEPGAASAASAVPGQVRARSSEPNAAPAVGPELGVARSVGPELGAGRAASSEPNAARAVDPEPNAARAAGAELGVARAVDSEPGVAQAASSEPSAAPVVLS